MNDYVVMVRPYGCGWQEPRFLHFSSECEARMWINSVADGTHCYTLRDRDGVTIVESCWPVLMVA